MKHRSAITAVLLALVCGGCRQDPSAIRLRYWGDLDEIKAMDALVGDFERRHPGTTIAMERKPADHSYTDLLLTEFIAKDAPDVIFISTNDFQKFAGGHYFADLNPYLRASTEVTRGQYYPLMIRAFQHGNALEALPRDTSPVAVIYYNKKLFDQAKEPYPKDSWGWDEFRRVAKKLTRRGADGLASQIGYAEEWNLAESWMLSAGGGMMDDPFRPTKFTADSPASIRGLRFRFTLQNVDRSMPSAVDDRSFADSNEGLFSSGKLAMFYSGIWKTPVFRQIRDFDWDVAMFPKGPGGRRAFPTGGSGYAMNAASAKKDQAWELIQYLSGPEGERRMALTGLIQPALRSLAASPAFLDGQKPRHKAMLLHAAEIGTLTPQAPYYQEFIGDIWAPLTDALWLDGAKIQDVDVLAKKAVDQGTRTFLQGK
jgi:multiple sugar transport system substrate-binding protein